MKDIRHKIMLTDEAIYEDSHKAPEKHNITNIQEYVNENIREMYVKVANYLDILKTDENPKLESINIRIGADLIVWEFKKEITINNLYLTLLKNQQKKLVDLTKSITVIL